MRAGKNQGVSGHDSGGVGRKVPPYSNTGVINFHSGVISESEQVFGGFRPGRDRSSIVQERAYVGAPAVDYLTGTTFSRPAFRSLRSLASSITDGDFALGRVMQYVGEQATGYFAGEGVQRGRDHFMVRCSGAYSHDLAQLVHQAAADLDGVNASRIDIQVSVLAAARLVRLADLGAQLQAGELGSYRRRAGKSKVNVIRGEDDLDTIYIGSRESERYIRVYEKLVGDVRFTRFEVEFKGSLAKSAFKALLGAGVDSLGSILRAELDALPVAFVGALGGVYEAVGDGASNRLRTVYQEPTHEKQLKWIQFQVAPTIQELLATPSREAVRALLEDWLLNF